MLHAPHRVSTARAGSPQYLGASGFVAACLIAFFSGCEAVPQWADDPLNGDEQDLAEGVEHGSTMGDERDTIPEASDDPPRQPVENERTTVACTAANTAGVSTLTYTGPDGTNPICPPTPCRIAQRVGDKQTDVTLHLSIPEDPTVTEMGEPILTLSGPLRGIAAAGTSTKTFGPLAPVSLDMGHIINITVGVPDFVEVTGAALSWIPKSGGSKDKPTPTSSTQAVGVPVGEQPKIELGACCSWCCDESGCTCLEYTPNGTECP